MMGDHAEAEALLRDVKATLERLHGPEDARTLHTTMMLGRALLKEGQNAKMEALYVPMLAAQQRVLPGPGSPRPIGLRERLGVLPVYAGQGESGRGTAAGLGGGIPAHQRARSPGHAGDDRFLSDILAMQ